MDPADAQTIGRLPLVDPAASGERELEAVTGQMLDRLLVERPARVSKDGEGGPDLAFEVVPLLLLFEMSIWLSVFMERRWDRGWDEEFAETGVL